MRFNRLRKLSDHLWIQKRLNFQRICDLLVFPIVNCSSMPSLFLMRQASLCSSLSELSMYVYCIQRTRTHTSFIVFSSLASDNDINESELSISWCRATRRTKFDEILDICCYNDQKYITFTNFNEVNVWGKSLY